MPEPPRTDRPRHRDRSPESLSCAWCARYRKGNLEFERELITG
jgi:DNA-binding helix-hairpin-helix protein with protein kinase domain